MNTLRTILSVSDSTWELNTSIRNWSKRSFCLTTNGKLQYQTNQTVQQVDVRTYLTQARQLQVSQPAYLPQVSTYFQLCKQQKIRTTTKPQSMMCERKQHFCFTRSRCLNHLFHSLTSVRTSIDFTRAKELARLRVEVSPPHLTLLVCCPCDVRRMRWAGRRALFFCSRWQQKK